MKDDDLELLRSVSGQFRFQWPLGNCHTNCTAHRRRWYLSYIDRVDGGVFGDVYRVIAHSTGEWNADNIDDKRKRPIRARLITMLPAHVRELAQQARLAQERREELREKGLNGKLQ